MSESTSGRLASLDILRGFDLFMLTVIGPLTHFLMDTGDYRWATVVDPLISHAEWAGFSPWDLIMPLFMFMSGVTIPFSMAKYRDGGQRRQLFWRLFKRVGLLWVLGMICQGNLLAFDPKHIYIFSNTLQAIAVGYLFSALLFIGTKPRTQVIVAAGLLLGYWAAMMFIRVDGYGGGDFTADGNLCEWVDRTVLGRFRHYSEVQGGAVVFPDFYRYTWILSSLNFIVTVLTGVFAGEMLKSAGEKKGRAALRLAIIGAAMVACGWLWNLQMPVIKKIWTSSMVLVSSGYCFLLLALFYYIVDCRGKGRWMNFLKVFGMNSIVAYMVTDICYLLPIQNGTPIFIAINVLLLVFLYRKKIFVRV